MHRCDVCFENANQWPKIKSKRFGVRRDHFVIVSQTRTYLCIPSKEMYLKSLQPGRAHSFFTPLRRYQSDRGKGRCVRDDREGALDEVLAVDAVAGEEYVGYLPQVGHVIEGIAVDYEDVGLLAGFEGSYERI